MRHITLRNLLVLGSFALWMHFSWGMLLILIVGPVVTVHNWWPKYNTELTVLFFEGYLIVVYLLIKPLVRLDRQIREANDKARNKGAA